jgi:hypothetical protein
VPHITEQRERLPAHLVDACTSRLEDLRCDRLALFHHAQQQVLRADVIVTKLSRFLDRQLQNALGLRRKRDFTEREGLGESREGALDFCLHRLQSETQQPQHRSGDAFLIADEAEKHVLGADEVVSEPPRFFPGQNDDSPRPFGGPFKH